MSGQLIGHRYRVLRKIGEGGMAVVHVAVDEKLGRDIAIKILKERFETHDEIRVRFQHEARAISSFDHPNILKIYDFSGEDSRQLWIVTELIHGRNLAQILETTPSGWLHPIIAASIVREICRALSSAHEHGVVHRDVKPENVMITHHGTVKLMDFGIAKIQRITSMTQTGMFMGSPSYMSPEQVRGRDVDNRSDIYSLGVLFYELITGRLPFTGSSTADIAMRILNGDYAHPKFIMAGIPENLNKCVVNCMELLPENRPQSVELVGEEIDSLLKSLGLDSSMQELERCFKDPKAYGDRLARILSVSEAKQEPTVIISNAKSPVVHQTAKWNSDALKSPIPRPDISGENLPGGSQRRDHLLPPRSVPHFTKKPISPELIAAHLPERRQQQRMAESTRLAKSAPGHAQQQKNIHVAPLPQSRPLPQHRQANPANHHALQRQAPRPANPVANQAIRPLQQASQQQASQRGQRYPDVKPVSRIVPLAPKKPVRHVRYVIHETYDSGSNSDFFSKLVIALLLLATASIIWIGNNRQNVSRSRSVLSQQPKNKKTTPQISTSATTQASVDKDKPILIAPPATSLNQNNNQQASGPAEATKNQLNVNSSKIEPLPKFAQKHLEAQRRKSGSKNEIYFENTAAGTLKPGPSNRPNKSSNKMDTTSDAKSLVEDKPINESSSKPLSTPAISPNNGAPKPNSPGTATPNDGILPAAVSKVAQEPDDIAAPTQATKRTPSPRKSSETQKLQEPPGKAVIAVSSAPAAELYIDGKRHGTTNDNGASSDWIEVPSGSRRIELRRAGFVNKKEVISVVSDSRQKLGPYILQRSDAQTSQASSYKLTVASNLPPVEVTITNIDNNSTQSFTLTQASKTLSLDRGIYEVIMNRKGEIRKRRIDLSGASQQLTFTGDFKENAPKNAKDKEE